MKRIKIVKNYSIWFNGEVLTYDDDTKMYKTYNFTVIGISQERVDYMIQNKFAIYLN